MSVQIKPKVIYYSYGELMSRTNLVRFLRGRRGVLWELRAEKLLVYLFSNIVQVVGDWSEQGSQRVVRGVLNLKLSEEDMKLARSGRLSATEITKFPWEDWFIYRLDGGEGSWRRSSS